MNDMTVNQPVRELSAVTSEIKFYKRQTELAVLAGAIEIGRRLVEAKAIVGHGNWGSYLRDEVEFSQSTANNMMRLYEEYGTGQTTLFGNSQSFMNLDPTKALKLLAIPAEERAEFAQENDVENKSVRELDELIRQRDDALQQIDQLGDKFLSMEAELKQTRQALEERDAGIVSLEQMAKEKSAEVDKLREQLDAHKEMLKNRKKEIEDLKNNPVVPEDTLEQLRKEAEAAAGAEAAEKAAKKYEGKLAKAEKELKATKEKLEEARQQAQDEKATADAALKQLRLASPDTAVFKTLFEQAQEGFNRLLGAYYKIEVQDPELAKNFKTAISTMLDQLKKAVEQ